MENNHRYWISIPVNIDDLDNIEVPWEDIRFEEFQFSKSDYDNLFDLFSQFCQSLDVMIDEYEEELIPASKVQAMIKMTENFASKASPAVKPSAEKFLVALRRAKELDKQILLSF